jgi:hypothetical protein
VCLAGAGARPARAQTPAPEQTASPHEGMDMNGGWQFMHDGVLFGVVNHQGSPRGGTEVRAPNWFMGMFTRSVGSSQLTFNTMFSLDPLTAGASGYGEIFQVGEALHGKPLIDRQHPHDLIMQLAAIWRVPVTSTTGFTLAGGPAGEPALGPVAFMHRASAAEYPFATLSHHTFDSTHIAYGVVTAAFDHGPFVVEASVFNGREPDERRWDFDFGALDSVSTRIWYRPTEEWEFQASTGHLVHPEELEPGNVQRTTASASWLRREDTDFSAITIGYGVNAVDSGTRQALFAEATRHAGEHSLFLRTEVLQVETDLLLADAIPAAPDAARTDTLGALTIGGVRDVLRQRGFEGGLGAALTIYAVPDALRPAYGRRPVSFQLFFRLRPPAGSAGRMWNMRMAQPMVGHTM